MKNLVNSNRKSSDIIKSSRYSMHIGQARSRVLMKISVALCTYNGEKHIEEQLTSILEQTQLPDEIVICDDSSTDDTVSVIRSTLERYAGKLILITNHQNIGYKKNFVQAMSLCSGDIIFLSDQDDVWEKNKIALLKRTFQDNPRAILVFHDAKLVDDQLKLLYNSFWKMLKFDPKIFFRYDYDILLERNVIQGSACAFRKKLFYKALPFPRETIHDEWLALVAIAEGEIIPIAQPLMKYRQSDNNLIGERSISIANKIKNWTTNIEKALNPHLKELLRREAVYEAYSKKKSGDSDLAKKIDFINCNIFLKKRVFCIKNSDLSIIKLLPIYMRMHICTSHAIKAFLKDLLTMCFYDKKFL